MKKTFHIIIALVFSISLFFILLFTSMELIVYNDSYFENHYLKRNIMAMTNLDIDELMNVTNKMLDYLKDKRNTLDMTANFNGSVEEVFGEREKLHMVDVKTLFVQATNIRNISVGIVILIGLLTFTRFKELFVFIMKSMKYVFSGIILLFAILGGLLYIDFNKYFTMFHLIFFDNDLWLLNPNTDVLINMVPADFFFETSLWILLVFFLAIALILFISRKLVKVVQSH